MQGLTSAGLGGVANNVTSFINPAAWNVPIRVARLKGSDEGCLALVRDGSACSSGNTDDRMCASWMRDGVRALNNLANVAKDAVPRRPSFAQRSAVQNVQRLYARRVTLQHCVDHWRLHRRPLCNGHTSHGSAGVLPPRLQALLAELGLR